jgi:serine phosphatase RsbU (regulator of sigma subunit)
MVVARISRTGELEYVNCGHVPPLVVSQQKVTRPQAGNLPVGLLADASYESSRLQLQRGDRLLLVTDGVTEAENARGDFYENERLEAIAAQSTSLNEIFASLANFCGGTPLNDDCTVVELVYTGT